MAGFSYESFFGFEQIAFAPASEPSASAYIRLRGVQDASSTVPFAYFNASSHAPPAYLNPRLCSPAKFICMVSKCICMQCSLIAVVTQCISQVLQSDPYPKYSNPSHRYSNPYPKYSNPSHRYSDPYPKYSNPSHRYSDLCGKKVCNHSAHMCSVIFTLHYLTSICCGTAS